MEETRTPRPSMGAAMAGVAAMVAVAVGVVSVVVIAADDDGADVSAGGGEAAAVAVELSEFAIDPDPIVVEVGASLDVANIGSIEHNLAVEGEDIRSEMLAGGASGSLDLGGLPAGEYSVLCEVPGHAAAGMTGTLQVGEGGETAAGGGGNDQLDPEAMTRALLDSFAAFPQETEGIGNQALEPTEVLADGTKVFDLTMEQAPWEVSAGNVVDAWTFNGMVPGPVINLDIGDRMQLRVANELPMATDVHLHGLNVENQSDGVSPLTQDLIEPGETFTYEYTADEQAVAMYHPHAQGSLLLPNGMFGAILVGDVQLPLGQTVGLEQVPADIEIAQEIPMVLNDSGNIGLSLNGKSFPATQPYTANVGDWVLIHYYNEGNLAHPMHLHQFDQIVVARDGYPIDPYTADTVTVAPGERYSVLVNIDKPGVWVWHCHILPHAEAEHGMFGMVTALVVE